jgi:hypothetical protein
MSISRIDEFKTADLNGFVSRRNQERRPYTFKSPETRAAVQRVGQSRARLYEYPQGMCAHPEGPFHDCSYVNARNALIPQAMQEAGPDMTIGEKSQSQRFCENMDRLWSERP